MNNKLTKNKIGEKFSNGIFVILLSIAIPLFAFVTEDSKITGFVVSEDSTDIIAANIDVVIQDNLLVFNNVDSLSTLATGNYYVDDIGIVYWLDDESKPAIAKVNFIDESQKNRHIYIDAGGRVGYILASVTIE